MRTESDASEQNDDSLALAQVFEHQEPFSHCVLGSLQRLLPTHSSSQRLMAIEVAADILKNGRGNSVQKFRRAGIDGAAVNRLVQHTMKLGRNSELIKQALDTLDDAQIRLLAYDIGASLDSSLNGAGLRDLLLRDAERLGKVEILTGEIMRRNPKLLQDPPVPKE